MKHGSGKSLRETRNTYFSSITFFFENRAAGEIMWKRTLEGGQTTDDNMAHEHWMLDI
jgi:hypothetical protein